MPYPGELPSGVSRGLSDLLSRQLLDATVPSKRLKRMDGSEFDVMSVSEILFDILNELRGLRRDLKMARLKDGKPIL